MLLQLLYFLPLIAVSTIGVIFGFKVRSGNNAVGVLTIVGWGILLGNQVLYTILWNDLFYEFLYFESFEDLLSVRMWTDLMAEGCVLFGILKLASSDTNFGNAWSSSTRYKPLDLYAKGDR